MTIKSDSYGSLSGYSSTGGGREEGTFANVFISGERRDGMDMGKMHAINIGVDFNAPNTPEKFLIHNAETINFIIMFIKKVRVKKEKLGRQWDEITYFSYNPDQDQNYPVGAKCEYIFAGILLNDENKPVKDPEGNTAFIYFRNKGMRVGPAVEYLGELNNKAAELEPLSDDPEFEKACVTPRRFITQVKIGSRESSYGNKDVYEYTAFKKLPDSTVEDILEKSVKWVEPFDKQFDLSSSVKGPQRGTGESASYNPDNENPGFEDSSADASADEAQVDIQEEDLDLGL
jgi:hypothetical protein